MTLNFEWGVRLTSVSDTIVLLLLFEEESSRAAQRHGGDGRIFS